MDKYAEAIEVINKMASVKMTMNAHKGDIEDADSLRIVQALNREFEELAETVMTEENLMHVIEEAADIHNFLIALVHQQINKYRTRKDESKRTIESTECQQMDNSIHKPPSVIG